MDDRFTPTPEQSAQAPAYDPVTGTYGSPTPPPANGSFVPPPPGYPPYPTEQASFAPAGKKSGFAVAALTLGIVACVFSLLPILNLLALLLAVLSVVFGIVALCKKAPAGKPVAAFILSFFALIFSVFLTLAMVRTVGGLITEYGADVREGLEEFITTWEDEMDGILYEYDGYSSDTDAILADYVSLNVGTFVTEDGAVYLPVSVTNTDDEPHDYYFELEAVDHYGNRIAYEYLCVENLAGGQSQNFDVFTEVARADLDLLAEAEVFVLSAEMYTY